MKNTLPSLVFLLALISNIRGSRFRAAVGHLERDRVLDLDVAAISVVSMSFPSAARCASFCLDLNEPNWACNMKANPVTKEIVCEVFVLEKNRIFETDLMSYPGSAVIYNVNVTRSGLQMSVLCLSELNAWTDDNLVISKYVSLFGVPSPTPHTVEIALNTSVISLECYKNGSVGGVIAEFSSGAHTNTSWKCAYPDAGDPVAGWKIPGFDEGGWNVYRVTDNTGSDGWSIVSEMKPETEWIWGGGAGWVSFMPEKGHVYCRKEDENECLTSPCQNGGTCTNVFGKYLCLCDVGHWGWNCEKG